MSVRMKGSKYYIAFRWKQHRMDTATSATSMAEAKRIEMPLRLPSISTTSITWNRRPWTWS